MELFETSKKAEISQLLLENPGMILEQIARDFDCSVENVINCLPEEMVKRIDSSRFVEIMQKLATFPDPMTFISHSEDMVLEVIGIIPNGSIGRGFYNFFHQSEGGLQGHLRYENCSAIYLIERPFMSSKKTVSLNFINQKGAVMFKIFVGRDKERSLFDYQIKELKALVE